MTVPGTVALFQFKTAIWGKRWLSFPHPTVSHMQWSTACSSTVTGLKEVESDIYLLSPSLTEIGSFWVVLPFFSCWETIVCLVARS